MTKVSIAQFMKNIATVMFLAVAIYGGYSVVGYATGTLDAANALAGGNCASCGGSVNWIDPFGGLGQSWGVNLDGGGGGGGGGFTPSCTLTLTQGNLQSSSYPPINQYILTWNAPLATSFTIDNMIGPVTPPAGGTYSFFSVPTTAVYTGTAVTPYGNVTCQTVALPPPPPPANAPACTLDLTKDKITWTTSYGFQVLISPLTNSPQIPGLTTGTPVTIDHGEADAYTSSAVIADMQSHGGINLPSVQGNTGFAPDQTTMNHVCTLLNGAGATASNIGVRTYSSPGNNAVVSYAGGTWTRTPGVSAHLSTSFSCVTGGGLSTYPLNGSYTFVPPLGVGTHTYHLVVNGEGGTKTCDATVVVPPPAGGCIQVLKETYNTSGQPITPVAQFTFTLDGATTAVNDANGNAIFNGVSLGTHTVTEVVPPTWTQLSVTPVSGIVNVTQGPTCAAVVFKNKQTLTPPPPPANGCIAIHKETYNTNSVAITPVAQFTFKLDGATTTMNDAAGDATFLNVTPGTHTVTEVVPPTWSQMSVVPSSGTVTVTSGSTCAPVTFKNKQVLTPPPGECSMTIIKTVSTTTTQAGDIVEYALNFKNTGTKDCTGGGVKVADVLDSRLTYASETHSSNVTGGYGSDPVYKSSDRTLRWNAATLTPGETGWVKFKATVGTPAACSETVPNKGKITSYEYNNFNTWVESNNADITLTKDCTPPPVKGCIQILKETYNTNGQPLTPVAQFTFKLDGTTTTTNDANGNATFNNVSAGTHTVTEVVPPTWTQLSITPVSGTVTVTPGPICAGVVFKNKQVLTPPPQECKLNIDKSANVTTVGVNGEVEYTINFKNIGDANCTGGGVKVMDVLDSRLTYASETHSSNVTGGYGSDPVYKSSDRTLRWNAATLTPGESGWVKVKAKGGTPTACSETVPNKAKITSYEYNNFGTFVESNSVDLTLTKDCNVPVPACTLTASPTTIAVGQSSTLTWTSSNITSVSIDQGVGSVTLNDSKSVSPTVNTTYTGTFTGPGGTIHCSATVTVTIPLPPGPACTVSVSASTVSAGQSIIVSWTSQNAVSGFINAVGTTTPVSGGSQEVFPSDDTTYTGTFKAADGRTVTCAAPVTLTRGGGGCSGNCGGGLNQPNVVLFQKPLEAPLAFVSLNQIPYTGFQAGFALTVIFWLAVGLLAAAMTYFAMGKGGLQLIFGSVMQGSTGLGEYAHSGVSNRPVPQQYYQNTEPIAYAVAAPNAPAPIVATTATDGIPELADVLESRAHAAGVLMSPEATRLAGKLAPERGEVLRKFGDILNAALKTLPREDGWILLTSDRFEELVGSTVSTPTLATPVHTPSVESILASVMAMPPAPVAAPARNVEMPMSAAADQNEVMKLVSALLAGNRDAAYATARSLEMSGAHASSVMTVIATALDQAFRARKHGTTTNLTVEAAAVSDEVLAKLVEVFTHGMDNSYANAFTGLKLAIAQAFEVRG